MAYTFALFLTHTLIMKHHLSRLTLVIFIAFLQISVSAQETRMFGIGSFFGGHIYSVNDQGDDFQVHKDFGSEEGMISALSELLPVNNLLFGATQKGGEFLDGILFTISSDGNYTKLFDFDRDENGKHPNCKLVVFNNRIWGTTQTGGANNAGTIFSMAMSGDDFQVEFHLTESQGKSPRGLVLFDDHLWALCTAGGTNNTGTLIKVDQSVEVVFNFPTDHLQPQLIPVFHGDFVYGIMPFSGASGAGEMFKIGTDGNNFEIVYTFTYDEPKGTFPLGITKINDVIVGTTAAGVNSSGTLYSFDPSTDQLTYLHHFDSESSAPIGPPILFNNKYWGITTNHGVVYSIDPDGENFAIVASDANAPTANGKFTELGGDFYCLTENGGVNGFGQFLKFNPETSDLTKLYDLGGAIELAWPARSLTGADEKLYGIATKGGKDFGGIFEMDITTSEASLLYSFDELKVSPFNGLIYDNGNLIGTGSQGAGFEGEDFIFSYDLESNTFSKLYTFDPELQYVPVFEPILYNNQYYGITHRGGVHGNGILYRLDRDGQNFEVLHSLSNQVNRITIADNTVFGTSRYNGENFDGYIFSYDLSNDAYEVIFDFSDDTGALPETGLKYFEGKLFGTTLQGDRGSVFRINPDGTGFSRLFAFTDFEEHGATPSGELLIHDNKIWGTTSGGGENGRGVIYSLALDGSNFQKHQNLDQHEGSTSITPLLILDVTSLALSSTVSKEIKSYPNPVKNSLYINVGNSPITSVSLIDLQGRTELVQTLETSGSIDVSGLSSGIYILRIISSEGVSIQKIRKE